MNELDTMAKALLSRKAEISRLTKEADELEGKIRKFMKKQKRETLSGDGWKASCKNVEVSRFDVGTFRDEHAKLYKAYLHPLTMQRFSISAVDGNTGDAAG